MLVQSERTKSAKSNQSAVKLLRMIEFLAQSGEPMRLLDIAGALDLNSSTALRFLATLQSCGYVEQDQETLKYYLTFKICYYANMVSKSFSFRDVAHPYLKKISKTTGESASLAVEQDMSVVYVDVEEGQDQMLRSLQRIGNIAPLHCTGIGKLFLLNYTDDMLDVFIAKKGLRQYTVNTLTSKEQLVEELEKIRIQGYSCDNEECETGARCIAYPIRNHTGKIIAGMSITGPTSRLTDEFLGCHKQFLSDCAAEISQKLGYKPE